MKIAAVIAEYNPFHNGHAYQLHRIKEHYGYDFVIVVMSGDFTQRGEPAIADKHVRANMALLGGADLVIELPAYYACASAEYFATGAVSLIHGLGCVDALFFGSESWDTDASAPNPPALPMCAANVLLEESDLFCRALSDSLKQGRSYAAARMDALTAVLKRNETLEWGTIRESLSETNAQGKSGKTPEPQNTLSAILSMPNNTLGIEYCKAILRLKSPVKPFALKRIGSGYHDVHTVDTYASAAAVRTLLFEYTDRNARSALVPHCAAQTLTAEESTPFSAAHETASVADTLSALVPQDTAQMLSELSVSSRLLTPNDFSELLHYQLLLQESEFERYADCTPELANRIRSLLPSLIGKNITEMIDTIKTRTYTHTRISRVLTHLLLGMTGDTLTALTDKHMPAFLTHARILGFRKEACGSLLSAVRKNACIPLITKPADYHPSGTAAALYEMDLLASHIYQGVAAKKSAQAFRHELTHSPLIV